MEGRMEDIYMVLIQVGTLLSAKLFFDRIFEKAESRLPSFFGILLYMTGPYRIYVCYDLADLSQAAVWMLVPLYAWAIAGSVRDGKLKSCAAAMATAAVVLAGIGYVDTVMFVILAGLTMLTALIVRKPRILISLAAGVVLFLPGLYLLAGYLFLGQSEESGITLQPIMRNGYAIGEYFQSYAYRNGHPGMGLGMLICLLTGLWLIFVKGEDGADRESCKTCRFFTGLSIFLVVLSTRYFPWDILQRMGDWSLRLISMIETPAVFWGLGFGCMCVPAARSVERISREKNKIAAIAVPVLILLVSIGVCVYQCQYGYLWG